MFFNDCNKIPNGHDCFSRWENVVKAKPDRIHIVRWISNPLLSTDRFDFIKQNCIHTKHQSDFTRDQQSFIGFD